MQFLHSPRVRGSSRDNPNSPLKKAYLRTPILQMGTRRSRGARTYGPSTPRTCTQSADGYPARRLAPGPF